MEALKGMAQVQLHEVKDGVQYYLLSTTIPMQPKINFIARYSELEAFNNEHMGIFGSAGANAFPKASIIDSLLSSTKNNPSKLKERTEALERWLQVAAAMKKEQLAKFVKQQHSKYGEPDMNKGAPQEAPFVPITSSAPNKLYTHTVLGLRVFDTVKRNWPKVADLNQKAMRFNCVYFKRGFIYSKKGKTLRIYYMPWGRSVTLARLHEEQERTTTFNFAVDEKRMVIWALEKTNFFSIDLKTGARQGIPTPSFLNPTNCAFNTQTKQWRELNPPQVGTTGVHLGVAVFARDSIFYATGQQLLKYDLIHQKWSKTAFSGEIKKMTWDKNNHQNAMTLSLDNNTLEDSADLQIEVNRTLSVFCDDLSTPVDAEWEGCLINHLENNSKAVKLPWDAIFRLDKMSEEDRDIMNEYGKLSSGERLQAFKKNKEVYLKVIKNNELYASGAMKVVSRYIFDLLFRDASLLADMPNYFARNFIKMKNVNTGEVMCRPKGAFIGNQECKMDAESEEKAAARAPALVINSSGVHINGQKVSINANGVLTVNQENTNATTTTTTTTTSDSSASSSSSSSASSTNSNSNAMPALPLIPEVVLPEEHIRRAGVVRRLKDKNIDVPPPLICAITHNIMFDPVTTCDGHSYEKYAIQMWLASGNQTSPLTNQKLENTKLIPSFALKNMVNYFLEKNDIQ